MTHSDSSLLVKYARKVSSTTMMEEMSSEIHVLSETLITPITWRGSLCPSGQIMARIRLLYLGSGLQSYILSGVDDIDTAPAWPAWPVVMILRLPDVMRRLSVGGRQKAVLAVEDNKNARVSRLLLL